MNPRFPFCHLWIVLFSAFLLNVAFVPASGTGTDSLIDVIRPKGNSVSNLTFVAFKHLTNGMVDLTFAWPVGCLSTSGVDLFVSTNLMTPGWSLAATTNVITSAESFSWRDAAATGFPVRFYDVWTLHDSDGDGLSDGREVRLYGTASVNPDTDGDGLDDGWEIRSGLNALDPKGRNGADGDPDGDWLSNLEEYRRGTDANNPDSDGDGLSDGFECGRTGRIVVWATGAATNGLPVDDDIVQIASGNSGLGLHADGSVLTWGASIGVPPGASNVLAVSGGWQHSLALLRDGSVTGWGLDSFGEIVDTPALTDVKAIAAGTLFSLALREDGRLVIWGCEDLQLPEAAKRDVVAMSASCGNVMFATVYTNMTVATWSPLAGEWGTFAAVTSIPLLTNAVDVAMGATHATALLVDGSVVSWGDDDNGVVSHTPVLTNAIAIAAGYGFSLALCADGRVVQWGYGAQTREMQGNILAIAATSDIGMALVSALNCNPLLADSDADGMPDRWEYAHGFNPLDELDADGDADNDGVSNLAECQRGCNPFAMDTDGDGLTDSFEIEWGYNPADSQVPSPNSDDDHDGLTVLQEMREGTCPVLADTDGDGTDDGIETARSETCPHGADPGCPDDIGERERCELLKITTSQAPAGSTVLLEVINSQTGRARRYLNPPGEVTYGVVPGLRYTVRMAATTPEAVSNTITWTASGVDYALLNNAPAPVEGSIQLGNGQSVSTMPITMMRPEFTNSVVYVTCGGGTLNLADYLSPAGCGPGIDWVVTSDSSGAFATVGTNGIVEFGECGTLLDNGSVFEGGLFTVSIKDVPVEVCSLRIGVDCPHLNLFESHPWSQDGSCPVVNSSCSEFSFSALTCLAGVNASLTVDEGGQVDLMYGAGGGLYKVQFSSPLLGTNTAPLVRLILTMDIIQTNKYFCAGATSGFITPLQLRSGYLAGGVEWIGGPSNAVLGRAGNLVLDHSDWPASNYTITAVASVLTSLLRESELAECSISDTFELTVLEFQKLMLTNSASGQSVSDVTWTNEVPSADNTLYLSERADGTAEMTIKGWGNPANVCSDWFRWEIVQTNGTSTTQWSTNTATFATNNPVTVTWSATGPVNRQFLVRGWYAGPENKRFNPNDPHRELYVSVIKVDMIPDYNRDGKIDQKDKSVQSVSNPYRFWVNDDNDSGYDGGDDIPGAPGLGVRDWEKQGLPGFQKYTVDGVRDLVDFMPVCLDLKNALSAWPAASHTYVLKHSEGHFNALINAKLAPSEAGYHLRNKAFCEAYGNAELQHIHADGFVLPVDFLNGITSYNEALILLESRNATEAPLVLEIINSDGAIVCRSEMPVKTSGVEQMFRHKNLIKIADTDPDPPIKVADRDTASNYPDYLCTSRWLVFVAGVNVDEQSSRGWQSSMFKSFYWAGSNAKFVGITYYAAEGSSVNYQHNVTHAFQTAEAVAVYVNGLSGSKDDKVVVAHSMGNILVSAAICDYHMAVSKYLMLNPAVALECYDGTTFNESSTDNDMLPPDWREYEFNTWASTWHKLFPAGDDRRKLTWKNRFTNAVPVACNFFSSEDQVFEINEDVLTMLSGVDLTMTWPIMVGTDRYSWHKQELFKGKEYGILNIGATDWAGWGFRETSTGNRVYSAEAANSASDAALSSVSVFRDNPNTMFSSSIAQQEQNAILAKGIPALSHCAGKNVIAPFFTSGESRNFDMSDLYKNGWPRDHAIYGTWWLHSDIREMSYVYIYKAFEEMVDKGALE